MKRKWETAFSSLERFESIYGIKPLESTLQIEMGGDQSEDVGEAKSLPISSGILSCDLFQYNRFYWNKNFFTFTHANCAMGLVFSYWKENVSYTAIFPIALPRSNPAVVCGSSNTPLLSADGNIANAWWPVNDLARIMVAELAYALNLCFAFSSPALASDTIGYQATGLPQWPLLQNVRLPPLLFDLLNDGLQLVIKANPNYVLPEQEAYAWTLMSLEPYMLNAPRVVGSLIPPQNNSIVTGVDKGWCGQGPYATGFGQYYQSLPKARYYDGYSDVERSILWSLTRNPTTGGVAMNFGQWLTFGQAFKMNTRQVGGWGSALPSGLNCSLIPSRYWVTQSDVLSQNQKRPMMSNSKSFSAATNVAVTFLTLNGLQTFQDETLSADGNLSNDSPVLYLRRNEAKNVLDLKIVDEWGNVLQDYTNCPGPGTLYDNGGAPAPAVDNSFPIYVDLRTDGNEGPLFEPDGVTPLVPGPYLSLNPFPIQNPTGNCVYTVYKIRNMWRLFFLPNQIRSVLNPTLPESFTAGGPPGMSMVHFGRILNTY